MARRVGAERSVVLRVFPETSVDGWTARQRGGGLEYVFGHDDKDEREVRPRLTVVHYPFAEVPLPAGVRATSATCPKGRCGHGLDGRRAALYPSGSRRRPGPLTPDQ
jgi:hypothetical protein